MKTITAIALSLSVLFSASLACQSGSEAPSVIAPLGQLEISESQSDTSNQAGSQPANLNTPVEETPSSASEVATEADSSQTSPIQVETIALDQNAGSFEGYTLFSPITSTSTYLIDNDGQLIHSWESNFTPGQSVYLLEDGSLLRTANNSPGPNSGAFNVGGAGGRIELYNWNGDLTWYYELNNDQYRLHHDVSALPNGNILAVAWEAKSAAEAITAGRDPNLLTDEVLWPDMIIEIEPSGSSGGTIVWEWHVWDHLIQDQDPTKDNYGIISEHPELIDLNFVQRRSVADWNHINSIDYNPELDQIIVSAHNFSELWIIDHSTTTAEATAHSGGNSNMGGDLLYRWGNPQVYDSGSAADQTLFVQHDAEWIDIGLPGEGNILIFNNGMGRPDGNYSTIVEITPSLKADGTYEITPGQSYAPESAFWTYTAKNPTDFYGSKISGSQRLPNGNTLICEGTTGVFFEANMNGDIVWSYINPIINFPGNGQGQSPQDQRPSGAARPGQQPRDNNKPNRAPGNSSLIIASDTAQGPDANPGNSVFKIERYAPDYPGLADKDLTPKGLLE
jgi:hypothetical protein